MSNPARKNFNYDDAVVLPRDLEAAKSVAGGDVLTKKQQEYIEILARGHATEGPSLFQLKRGLRTARNEYEQLWIQMLESGIQDAEIERRMMAIDAQPVDQRLLDLVREDLGASLRDYSELMQIIIRLRTDQGQLGAQGRRELEDEGDFYAGELQRPYFAAGNRMLVVLKLMEEVRLIRGWDNARIGDVEAASALDLLTIVFRTAGRLWQHIRGIAHRGQTERNYRYATSVGQLYTDERMAGMPLPNTLSAQLQREMTAARLLLRERMSGANEAAAPGTAKTAASKAGRSKRSTATAKVNAGPQDANDQPAMDLKNWAVVLIGANEWWLLRQVQGRWTKRRRIRVPAGDPTTVLTKFAEGQGRVSREEARTQLKPRKIGKPGRKVARGVTYGLNKAKTAILRAIADEFDGKPPRVPKLWRHDQSGWMSAITLCIATEDDDGRPTLARL